MRFETPTPAELTKKVGVDVSGLKLDKLWREVGRKAPPDAMTANLTGFNIVLGDELHFQLFYTDTQRPLSAYDVVVDIMFDRVSFKKAPYTGRYGATDWWLVLRKIPQIPTMAFKNAIPAKKPKKKKRT